MPTELTPGQDAAPVGSFHSCGRNRRNKSYNLKLATWNIRTLLDSYGRSERPHRRTALVAAELSRYNIDIAALSETRFLDEGSLTEEGMGYTFYWKGYPPGGQHLHGMGLAIKNTLLPRLTVQPVGISERLMTLRIPLVKNRYATLLSVYDPTLPSDSESKDSFYQTLDEALHQIPKNDKILLLGDFNASVGKNSVIWKGVLGRHGVGQANSNGMRLLTLCSEHNLTITNTIFQQKTKYKTSWMHPCWPHWHLIDYVIVRRSDIRDVLITRAMRGAECWTDHRIIMTTVFMKLQLLKQGGYLCTRTLHRNIPQQWRDANIVTIYKSKGDRAICGNHRGISLLTVAGKVLAKVMLQRLINDITESMLPESKCGFRKNRSTVNMVFTIRQLQEKCREQHKDLFMVFVDLSKAFDTVQRDLLWEVFHRIGCPTKFVNILRQFHEGMTARVTTGGQQSSAFPVRTGVRQGCVLAPVLFNIFLICVTQLLHKDIEDNSGVTVAYRLDGNLFNIRSLQATTKLHRVRILELQYADDCALISHSPQGLQSVLDAAVRAYSRMGLTINTAKTEVICQWSANIPPTPPIFTIADEKLSVVPSFKYLESIISEDNSIDNEVQNRIKQASVAFGRLRRRVFQNKNLHPNTKICVYQAVCITTLLYSCEAWVTNTLYSCEAWVPYSRHIKSLEHFHIFCLQRILGITWQCYMASYTKVSVLLEARRNA
ncbi:uncharacterized protein LOC143109310 [Alosa pseudoharengus]|uniref:uncharacterized protein LOC143109310 n=1 Tax=Alosa pseudoharengus TaxID=34774 RepID=UPI003F89E8D4